MVAQLAETCEADDTLALVRAGIIRGLSVEFIADRERLDAGVRVIEGAQLRGIAVVDQGTYPASVVSAMRARFPGEAAPPLSRRRFWL